MLSLAGLGLAALVLYPTGRLLSGTFTSRSGQVPLALYLEALQSEANRAAAVHSVTVAGAGTLIGTLLGVSLAWLVSRSDVQGRRWFRPALAIPYIIPPFIGAIAWVYLLGPVGYLTRLVFPAGGAPFRLYGFGGVLLVMVLYGYPIPYVTALAGFESIDAEQEEAARTSGAGPWRAFRNVTLPALVPAIGAGAGLLFLSLLSNFGIAQVIGFPGRYFVMTTRIYALVLDSSRSDNLQAAAALSLLLAVGAAGGIALANGVWRVATRGRGAARLTTGRTASRGAEPVALGPWRPVCAGLMLLFLLFSVVAPLTAIAITSLTPVYGLSISAAQLSLTNYHQLLALDAAKRALTDSLLLAAGAAALIVAVSSALGYLNERQRSPVLRLLEWLLSIPYVVPGTVVGVAFILAFAPPLPLLHLRLYNTIWIIFLSYLARFALLGLRSARATVRGIDVALEEAGRVSGAGAGRVFRDVVFPLLRPASLATIFLVFAPAFSEATLSPLLISVGHETVGALALGLNDEGQVLLVAALSAIILVIVMLVQGLALLGSRRSGRAALPEGRMFG
ncbi:MAG: ABC transporter permease [Chloroflexota bacterium]